MEERIEIIAASGVQRASNVQPLGSQFGVSDRSRIVDCAGRRSSRETAIKTFLSTVKTFGTLGTSEGHNAKTHRHDVDRNGHCPSCSQNEEHQRILKTKSSC